MRDSVCGDNDREFEPHDGYVVVFLEKELCGSFPACDRSAVTAERIRTKHMPAERQKVSLDRKTKSEQMKKQWRET